MDELTRRILNDISKASGSSHDPRARINKNDDYRSGYQIGLRNEAFDLANNDHPITREFKRRGYKDSAVLDDSFQAWKRGYWAGRLTAINAKNKGGNKDAE